MTVLIPARDEAETIGEICGLLASDLMGSVIDEIVVIDCDSDDETAKIAFEAGARVEKVSEVLPETPWVLGKGEAMWRGLATVETDLVCFIDGDIRNFDKRFVERLITPLFNDATLGFTKGFYRRAFEDDSGLAVDQGGRVTELTARPLLNVFYPELAGFLQPLAGEYAGRTELLKRVPFLTGYGVDVGLLIDLFQQGGLQAMAQVDLIERVHRNRPLHELRMMASAIADAIIRRAQRDGRLHLDAAHERPVLLPGAGSSLEVSFLDQEDREPLNRIARRNIQIASL